MSDSEKTYEPPLAAKDTNCETSVMALSEYDEYLGLCEVMTEEKMKNLVRKIE
jgi:hypothetical protein